MVELLMKTCVGRFCEATSNRERREAVADLSRLVDLFPATALWTGVDCQLLDMAESLESWPDELGYDRHLN